MVSIPTRDNKIFNIFIISLVTGQSALRPASHAMTPEFCGKWGTNGNNVLMETGRLNTRFPFANPSETKKVNIKIGYIKLSIVECM